MKTYNKEYLYRDKEEYDKTSGKWNYAYHYIHYRKCKYCGNCDSVERTKRHS